MHSEQQHPIQPGDSVLVVDGYFVDDKGTVKSVERAHAIVEIDIFGRPNPTKLTLDQLTKTDDINPIEGGPQDYDKS